MPYAQQKRVYFLSALLYTTLQNKYSRKQYIKQKRPASLPASRADRFCFILPLPIQQRSGLRAYITNRRKTIGTLECLNSLLGMRTKVTVRFKSKEAKGL